MIERVTSSQFSQCRFFARNRPVVIVDALAEWKVTERWTPRHLTDVLGEKPTIVMMSRDGHFKYNSTTTGSITPAYDRTEMTFAAASRAILAKEGARTLYVMQQSIPERFPELMRNLPVPEWIPNKEILSILLWFGRGTTTPLHYDIANNFFVQVYGQKRFIIFSPDDSKYLYPCDIASTAQHISQVDPDQPDCGRYQQLANASAVEFVVDQGEVLFLPSFWWHHVSATDVAVSVSLWSLPRLEQILQTPIAARSLYLNYMQDRCIRFARNFLDPHGLSFVGAARVLLQHGGTLGACILAIAAFDEYLRNAGMFLDRPAGCALSALQAELIPICGRLTRERKAPLQLLGLLPEVAARAALGNDDLLEGSEVKAVLDAVSLLASDAL